MKLAVPINNKDHIHLLASLGVDTMILGIKGYAHRMEETFALDTIKPLVETIKKQDKAVWINLNALCHEADLPGLKTILRSLEALPIDGILYADLAVYQYACAFNLKDKLIYYPETYTTSAHDVLFWQEEGIQSLVVGREMTLDDIHHMACVNALPLTLVGHGYLNMFHSRRPLVETFFKHTKDHNPEALKDNRQLTLVEERRNESYPILQDGYGTHIFRTKPIASFSVLDQLKPLIETMIIDTVLLKEDAIIQAIKDYRSLLDGEPVDVTRYDTTTDTGFYFKETGATKGEQNS